MSEATTSQPSEPARATYYEETSKRATAFCRDLLLAVPELASLVIVPTWKIPSDRLPIGIIEGQATSGSVEANLQLAQAINQMLTAQSNRIGQLLGNYDMLAGQLAERIKQRQQELTAIEEQLRAATTTKDIGSGDGGETQTSQ